MDLTAHTPRSVIPHLVLIACASIALSGCGGGDREAAAASNGPSSGGSPAPVTSPTPPSAPSPTPTPSPTEPTPPAPQNAAPSIAGTAIASISVNSTYSFVPAATDSDGDTLAFQIQNKPAWATFSTVNGKLSGTPMLADEGTYPDIVISVNDGKTSASLEAFSITVNAPAAADSSTLTWIAPTQYEDGSSLSDLAGFTIVYGPSEDALYESLRIENPGIDRYVLDGLPAGTYYFGVRAFTDSGVESAVSNIVSKVIR